MGRSRGTLHPRMLTALGGVWAMAPRDLSALARAWSGQTELTTLARALDPARVAWLARRPAVVADDGEIEMGFDEALDAHIRPSGVAVLPIQGPLMAFGGWCYQGYDQIGETIGALKALAVAGQIRAVVCPINSPGGEVSGLNAVCAQFRDLRSVVPVIMVAHHLVNSAAQVIADQGSAFYVSPDSCTGHRGVWSRYENYSELLKREGVVVEYYQRGALKTYFAGDVEKQASTDEIMDSGVEHAWNILLDACAAGRAALTKEIVASQEARTYFGLQAIEAGFADDAATLAEVFAALEG